MCFYYDYDHVPEVCEDDPAAVSGTPLTCAECKRTIPAGEPHRHVHMEQYETPREPEWYDEGDDGNDEGADDPARMDPGEVFDCRVCAGCCRILASIRAAELAEGCGEHEAVPALEDLAATMRQDRIGGGRYAARAVADWEGAADHIERLVRSPAGRWE